MAEQVAYVPGRKGRWTGPGRRGQSLHCSRTEGLEPPSLGYSQEFAISVAKNLDLPGWHLVPSGGVAGTWRPS